MSMYAATWGLPVRTMSTNVDRQQQGTYAASYQANVLRSLAGVRTLFGKRHQQLGTTTATGLRKGK